jgi:hypothetical protein
MRSVHDDGRARLLPAVLVAGCLVAIASCSPDKHGLANIDGGASGGRSAAGTGGAAGMSSTGGTTGSGGGGTGGHGATGSGGGPNAGSGGASAATGGGSVAGAPGTGGHGNGGGGAGGRATGGSGGPNGGGSGGTPGTGTGGTPSSGTCGMPSTGTGGTPSTGTGGMPATGTGGMSATGTGGRSATGTGGASGTGGKGGNGGAMAAAECAGVSDCRLDSGCCTCEAAPVSAPPPPDCELVCVQSRCSALQLPPNALACVAGRCVAGFNCDTSNVTCRTAAPACDVGQVPAVTPKGDCYTGSCVPPTQCATVTGCGACASAEACVVYQTQLGIQFHCVTIPNACNGDVTCGCLGPTACTDAFRTCGNLSGQRGITCSCPNC